MGRCTFQRKRKEGGEPHPSALMLFFVYNNKGEWGKECRWTGSLQHNTHLRIACCRCSRDRHSARNMARFASQASREILLLCILATAGQSNAQGSKKAVFKEEAPG